MKAIIYYRVPNECATTRTIEVEESEPCSIVRKFIKITGLTKHTYISHIRCGHRDYIWEGTCHDAF